MHPFPELDRGAKAPYRRASLRFALNAQKRMHKPASPSKSPYMIQDLEVISVQNTNTGTHRHTHTKTTQPFISAPVAEW